MQSEEQQVVIKLAEYQDECWKAFSSHTTEMIITKKGRSLFPQIEYDIKGLDPKKYYAMIFEFQRVNDNRYKYVNDKWVIVSDTISNPNVYYRPKKIAHFHEIKSGEFWMGKKVNFSQVKLTSNMGHEGSSHIFLHTLHMYVPVLSIHELDKEKRIIIQKPVAVKRIEYTKFMAVTAYNNPNVVSLKIANNKYAKAFRFSEHPPCSNSLSPEMKRVRYEENVDDKIVNIPSSSAQVQPLQVVSNKLCEQIVPVTPLRTLENMISDSFFEKSNILQQPVLKQENDEMRDFSACDNLPVLQKLLEPTPDKTETKKVDSLFTSVQTLGDLVKHKYFQPTNNFQASPQFLKRKNDESGNFSAGDSLPGKPANTPQSEKQTPRYPKPELYMKCPSISNTIGDCHSMGSKVYEAPHLTPYWMTTREKIIPENGVSQSSFSNKNKTPLTTGQSSSKSKKKGALRQLKPSPPTMIGTHSTVAAAAAASPAASASPAPGPGPYPMMLPQQAMSLYSQYALYQAAAIAPYFMNFGASFPASPHFSPMFQHLSKADNSQKEVEEEKVTS